jgi:hypothetical protein
VYGRFFEEKRRDSFVYLREGLSQQASQAVLCPQP